MTEQPQPLISWLEDRRANAARIAATKTTPADIAGWIEDAEYFKEAIERIGKAEAERDALRHDLYERSGLVTAQNFAEMQQRAEKAEEQLRHIYDWCDAYPLGFGSGIFDEPDIKQVQALLGDKLLTQLSAHNFRHVLNGVKAIAARKEQP